MHFTAHNELQLLALLAALAAMLVLSARGRLPVAVFRELLDAERGAVLALRNEGAITEEVMHRVQRDIDLEDSRLDV